MFFSVSLNFFFFFFFFNDTATTEIYTLSLHDALPIWRRCAATSSSSTSWQPGPSPASRKCRCSNASRSEEHTSELQSRPHLVCRLLLEKKKPDFFQHIVFLKKKKQNSKI